jgi:hypothetical protein
MEVIMVNSLKNLKQLESLKIEHKVLESEIDKVMRSKVINQFELQSLKKRKLSIKESITQLEAIIFGDIVA